MIKTSDIYQKADKYLAQNGYWQASLETKKELITKAMTVFIITKIQEFPKSEIINLPNLEEQNISNLLQILADLIPKEEHPKTLNHFIHYLLINAGSLQGFEIIWLDDSKKEPSSLPAIEFGENSIWNFLTTHPNDDYVKTFIFVHYVFNTYFLPNTKPQELSLSFLDCAILP